MNVELYIENEKVDLSDKISFPLNKKWDNLLNPTDIINDYSKVVSIPRTKHNDTLFGNIFKLDKYIPVQSQLGAPSYAKSGTWSNNVWTVTATTAYRLQVGVIDTVNYDDWTYTYTKDYIGNYGSNTWEFEYKSDTMHRLEFSIRDKYSNELDFLQFNLTTLGLAEGHTYIARFNYTISGGIVRVSKISLAAKDNNKNIYFNPAKKASFRLLYNGQDLMDGYCKMNVAANSVDNKNYEINLFGTMGDLFQDMRNITFNEEKATDPKYVVSEHFSNVLINKDTVKASWENPQTNVDVSSTNFNDWIGWMPCNRGLYDNFDSTKFEDVNGNICDFVTTLQKKDSDGNTQGFTSAEAETIVGEGISEGTLREYRSYYQKPYVYCNKLVQLLKEKFEENNPDYKLNLDSSFFHLKNPYWTDLVMGCDYSETKDSDVYNNYYNADCNNSFIDDGDLYQIYWSDLLGKTPIASVSYNDILDVPSGITGSACNLTETVSSEAVPLLNIDGINFDTDADNQYKVNVDTSNLYLYFVDRTGTTRWTRYPKYIYMTDLNALRVTLEAVDDSDNVLADTSFLIGSDASRSKFALDYSVGHEYDNFAVLDKSSGIYYEFAQFSLSGLSMSLVVRGTSKFRLRLKAAWEANVQPLNYSSTYGYGEDIFWPIKAFLRFRSKEQTSNGTNHTATPVSNYVSIENTVNNRSNKPVALGDMLGEDFNLFDFFVKYCKTFGLVVDYDNINKEINVMTRNKYFGEYSIEDWSDKVDRSKDFQIAPVAFEHKYELFDYEETDGAYYNTYRDKYGIGYGGKRLDTGYEFNNEPEELMQEGYVSTILSQEHTFDWNDLYDTKIINKKSLEAMPAMYEIDGNQKKDIEVSGNFMFRKSENLGFDSNLRKPCITDDTYKQMLDGEYYWSQGSNSGAYKVTPEARPNIDVEDEGYGCLWHQPSEVYYDYKANDSIYIYDCAWNAYISDRYSYQNRKVTGYFNLSPNDYMQFKFYKFVSIDDCLYMVNQIYDYDVNNIDTTKVELIQVSDISKYTNGQMFVEEPHWLKAYGKDVPNRGNKTLYYPATGGTQPLYIELSTNNKPYTLSKPSWAKLIGIPIESNGKIILRVKVLSYTGAQGRKALLTVSGAIDSDSVMIAQEPCYISTDKTYAKITDGESIDLSVYTNVPQSGVTVNVAGWSNVYTSYWKSEQTGGGGARMSGRTNSSVLTVYKFPWKASINLTTGSKRLTVTLTTSCGASCTVIIDVVPKSSSTSTNITGTEITSITASTTATTTTIIRTPTVTKFKDTNSLVQSYTIPEGAGVLNISELSNGQQTISVVPSSVTAGTVVSVGLVRNTTSTERANQTLVRVPTTGSLQVGVKKGKINLTSQKTLVITFV